MVSFCVAMMAVLNNFDGGFVNVTVGRNEIGHSLKWEFYDGFVPRS